MNIALIKFGNQYYDKTYEFKSDIEGLTEGNTVVCDTVNGLTIGTVAGFKESSNVAKKWLVDKVDMLQHAARLAHEKSLADVKKKMEKRRKEIQDVEIYSLLAQNDPVMASLLEQFKSMQN